MKMNNKLYDILNKVQRWIPSLAVFYLALCKIWGLALGQQVSDTLMAIAAFLATTLEISTGVYHKDVTTQLLGGMVSGAFEDAPSEDEPTESEPSDAE
jgi:hypothetical protein